MKKFYFSRAWISEKLIVSWNFLIGSNDLLNFNIDIYKDSFISIPSSTYYSFLDFYGHIWMFFKVELVNILDSEQQNFYNIVTWIPKYTILSFDFLLEWNPLFDNASDILAMIEIP